MNKKLTLKLIVKLWLEVYGEDLKKEYSEFYNKLKKNSWQMVEDEVVY